MQHALLIKLNNDYLTLVKKLNHIISTPIQQYPHYIVVVLFIGGGNQITPGKPATSRKYN